MNYNGTITIKFTDGLASLVIDDGASRIPVGILDRWMRTKGIKLFRAQQMQLDKKRAAAKAGLMPLTESPKAPVKVNEESPRKVGIQLPKQKEQPKRTMPGPLPLSASGDKTDEQNVEAKVTKSFMAGKAQPELEHPEMDKIEAAIARATSESENNSAKEEKVNG